MTHTDFQPGRSDCPGNLTARYQLSRRSGQFTVYTCQQCGWSNAPQRRRRRRQQTDQQPGVRAMKIRIGASSKEGKGHFGSYGSSAEIELTLDDEITVEQAISAMRVWQKAADQVVEDEQRRKSERYPGPRPTVEPAAAAAPARPDPIPPRSEPREPRRWDPDDLPPAPAREPEPGPPARNPGAGPTRNGSGGNGRGKPRSGRELIGWANGQSKYEELLRLAKRADRGRIIDWDQDMIDWAYNDLSRPVGAGWGDGRN